MSDRVNDELLSAYLDNEVTEEERAKVERALMDSPETRTSLESLKQVQSRLQAMPRLTLADDFHERVVREVERRSVAQAVAPGTVRSAETSKWMRNATIATTVAAVLVVGLFIAINRQDSEIVENPDPNVEREVPQPGELKFVGLQRPQPKLILVFDLAITKQGQDGDVFGKTLRQAGIVFNPRNQGVKLDEDLQNDLLDTRFAAGVNQPEAGKVNEPFAVVDMVYVQGTKSQIDEIYSKLWQHEQVHVVLDMAFDPKPMRVLNMVGERSWSLAKSESTESPGSYAYRLNIGITLHTSRVGILARFPTPTLKASVGPNDTKSGGTGTGIHLPIPLNLGGNQPKAGEDEKDPVYEILVIRRNLKLGFPENAQKSDDE